MPRGEPYAGDFVPGMRREGDVGIDHECGAMADNPALVFGDELTLREAVDMSEQVVARIAHAGAVDAFRQADHRTCIGRCRVADDQFGS